MTIENDKIILKVLVEGFVSPILQIVPFHKDFSSSGEQLEHRKLAHDL